jgi:hypothetical protein
MLPSDFFSTYDVLTSCLSALPQACTEASRENFIGIGGMAIIIHGGDRFIEKVDAAVTTQTLKEFEVATKDDNRFKIGPGDACTYSCTGERNRECPCGDRVLVTGLRIFCQR